MLKDTNSLDAAHLIITHGQPPSKLLAQMSDYETYSGNRVAAVQSMTAND